MFEHFLSSDPFPLEKLALSWMGLLGWQSPWKKNGKLRWGAPIFVRQCRRAQGCGYKWMRYIELILIHNLFNLFILSWDSRLLISVFAV